ncbi:MAG: stage III sporulation protein AA [Bacillota bacterium]|nr:stage III sporulation protein AA [Bacillota bacterium]
MSAKLPLKQVLDYLPPSLRKDLQGLPAEQAALLEEIRIKAECPLLLRFHQEEAFLQPDGSLSREPGLQPRLVSGDELNRIMLLLSDSSFYALEEELRRGYITLPGGHRAGLVGRAVLEKGCIRTMKDISSVNLRLARPVPGAARELLPQLLDGQGSPCQSLIVSPPRAGKTTLLRDLTRMLSDGEGVEALRVGLVDERSELAAMRKGQAQLPVGLRTDVLDGCPKAEGLLLMLRSMSPQLLVCDELGREEDVEALREAARAGVKLIASAHGRDERELLARPVLSRLLKENCFERIVILSRRLGPGTIERVIRL